MKPTAAKGRFPYPHPNMAEVWAHERGERLSGFVECEPRNVGPLPKPPRYTDFGREKK